MKIKSMKRIRSKMKSKKRRILTLAKKETLVF